MERPHNRMNRRGIVRWSPSTWVLAALGLLIVLISADQVYRALNPVEPTPDPPLPVADSGPQVGKEPLDFGLPDSKSNVHQLSAWKGKQFVLNFYCGCPSCTTHATRLAALYRLNKKTAPTIAVMTEDYSPAGIPGFRRASKADFLYLFSTDEGKVVEQYHGTPCPRSYVIGADWKVKYASPPDMPGVELFMAEDVAKALGLKVPVTVSNVPKKPVRAGAEPVDSPRLAPVPSR